MKKLSPFKNLLITVGNLPTAYIESMSYYEALTYLVNYICNNIDPNVKANTEAIKELQEYVTTYFDNLDVQKEINNKLDEMASDGTLAQIINEQVFDTLNDRIDGLQTQITGLNNYLNINNFVNYHQSLNNLTGSGTASADIFVARNNAGTLCKIYGNIQFDQLTQYESNQFLLNVDTGLRPDTDINVIGVMDSSDYSYNPIVKIRQDGKLEFAITPNSEKVYSYLSACIIFVKDFGD